MAEISRQENQPPAAASLPEELLMEILPRVPYKSLCRFRCASPSWLALCTHPFLLRRPPQTLSGFFCYALDPLRDARFLDFPVESGGRALVDTSLPFLRGGGGYTHGFVLVDCCGGLLLCKCFTSPTPASLLDTDYLVCNPATENWAVLPRNKELHPRNVIRMCFDPAAPSRFAVLVFVQDLDKRGELTGVEIYSSETGTWASKQIGWRQGTCLDSRGGVSASVFMNGALHLATHNYSVVAVDMDGETWREFTRPYCGPGYIGRSQGRLHAMRILSPCHSICLLTVWVLEDYASGDWTMKHSVNILRPLGRHIRKENEFYTLIAIHPECDLIFFIDGVKDRLMSYHMDSQEVQIVYNKARKRIPYHPYTPYFAEWLPTRLPDRQ